VRFEIVVAASVKMTVLCIVALCNLVEVYEHLRGACFHHFSMEKGMMVIN
jgi:hypothetical protein